MSATQATQTRSIAALVRCGQDGNLISVWTTEVGRYAHGQIETESQL